MGPFGDLWGHMGTYGVHGALGAPMGPFWDVWALMGGVWGRMRTYWHHRGPIGAYGDLCGGPMGTFGDLWAPMGPFGDLCGPMGTYEVLWEPMGTYGGLCGPTYWDMLGRLGT